MPRSINYITHYAVLRKGLNFFSFSRVKGSPEYDQSRKLILYIFLKRGGCLYARFLCSRAHSAKRARDDRVSYIQGGCMQYTCIQYTLSSRTPGMTATRANVSCIQARYPCSRELSAKRQPQGQALYARYLCSRDALGLIYIFKEGRLLVCKIPLLALALGQARARR